MHEGYLATDSDGVWHIHANVSCNEEDVCSIYTENKLHLIWLSPKHYSTHSVSSPSSQGWGTFVIRWGSTTPQPDMHQKPEISKALLLIAKHTEDYKAKGIRHASYAYTVHTGLHKFPFVEKIWPHTVETFLMVCLY